MTRARRRRQPKRNAPKRRWSNDEIYYPITNECNTLTKKKKIKKQNRPLITEQTHHSPYDKKYLEFIDTFIHEEYFKLFLDNLFEGLHFPSSTPFISQ